MSEPAALVQAWEHLLARLDPWHLDVLFAALLLVVLLLLRPWVRRLLGLQIVGSLIGHGPPDAAVKRSVEAAIEQSVDRGVQAAMNDKFAVLGDRLAKIETATAVLADQSEARTQWLHSLASQQVEQGQRLAALEGELSAAMRRQTGSARRQRQ